MRILIAVLALLAVLLLAYLGWNRDAYSGDQVAERAPRSSPETRSIGLAEPAIDPDRTAESAAGAQEPNAPKSEEAPAGSKAAIVPPETSIEVRWRGSGGQSATALAVRGHRAFMDGLRPSDEVIESELEPVEPGLATTRFDGLAHGPWSIGVRDAAGEVRWAAALLRAESPQRVVSFTVGTSSVQGTVWSTAGEPLADAVITVQCPSSDSGPQRRKSVAVRGRSQADGRYELHGLHGGGGWFSAEWTEGAKSVELASHVLAIPHDGSVTVDVGAPTGVTEVTLTVVDVMGEPIGAGSVESHERNGARTVHGKLDTDGRVTLELPPGQWQFQLWGLDGNHGMIGEVDVVGGGTLQHRLHVGGARILGELVWPEGQPSLEVIGAQTISLRQGDDATGHVVRRSKLTASGRFRFDRVEPGTYTLTASPRRAVPPVTITLGEGETNLRVTLPMDKSD